MRPFAMRVVAVALFSTLSTLPTLPMLAQEHRSGTTPEVGALAAAPAFDNLGDHHRTISTYLPQAQRYFDQGLRLMFAFNLEEAERSFRAAVAIDPTNAHRFTMPDV